MAQKLHLRLVANVLTIFVALWVLAAVSPQRVSADSIYYVAMGGSDANVGTAESPWRTLQKAADTLVAGDTVVVRAGDYPERVQVSRSGSAGAPITFQAEGTVVTRGFTVRADYVAIRGFDVTNTPNHSSDGVGIFVEGSYCTIEDNYVYYATRGGIQLWADPGEYALRTHCAVRNNTLFRNSQWGIEVYGQNHLIQGNDISRSIQFHPAWTSPPGYVDADGIRFFGSGHLFSANYIHDITYSDPENSSPHIDCFQTWDDGSWHEAARDIVFERNRCIIPESLSSSKRTNGFMLEQASFLTIRNNILFANTDVNAYSGTNSALTIVNNVFVGDLAWPSGTYPAGVNLTTCANTVVKNNIFYNLPGSAYLIWGTNPGLDISHNLAYRSDGRTPAGTAYPNDLWGVNPLFVNAGAGDFHLQPGSPAVDTGHHLGATVPDDFEGVPRPQAAGYDRGIFEPAGSVLPTASPTSAPTSTPTNTPAPLPSNTPTPAPTSPPTAAPTSTPTATRTNTPAPLPTNTPTSTPTSTPTAAPTSTPTATRTNTPAPLPSNTPTATRTSTPTAAPTSTPTATRTNTPAPASTPTVTPTATRTNTPVVPTATPTHTPTVPGAMMHIGDMDGTGTIRDSTYWRARVTLYVHDANHQPVAGAVVSASWSQGATGAAVCTTRSAGNCTFAKNNIPRSTSAVRFTVLNVTSGSFTYAPAANHDPEGDSSSGSIVVARP